MCSIHLACSILAQLVQYDGRTARRPENESKNRKLVYECANEHALAITKRDGSGVPVGGRAWTPDNKRERTGGGVARFYVVTSRPGDGRGMGTSHCSKVAVIRLASGDAAAAAAKDSTTATTGTTMHARADRRASGRYQLASVICFNSAPAF